MPRQSDIDAARPRRGLLRTYIFFLGGVGCAPTGDANAEELTWKCWSL